MKRFPRAIRNRVTTQPQLIRSPERGEQRCSFSPQCCILGGRAFGPPLCRGCAPATPPYKTMPRRPCAFIATCRLASMAAAAHQLCQQEPEWFRGRLAGQLLWLGTYETVSSLSNIPATRFLHEAAIQTIWSWPSTPATVEERATLARIDLFSVILKIPLS